MCTWGPRADTPERLAPRFLRTLAALSESEPDFTNWHIGHTKHTPLAAASFDDVVKFVADGNDLEGTGAVFPKEGYWFSTTSFPPNKARRVLLRFHAGCTIPANLFINTAALETGPLCAENASLITLSVLKPALLVLASLWEPMWCGLAPWSVHDFQPKRGPHQRPRFGVEWVTYLSPRFAPLVTPPRTAITEYLPNGALLMIATEDRFTVDNPEHLATARDIEAALAPVNALPWPPDGDPAS
ncbi:MAG TPA: Imm52 family immunity protein [Stellaceae bacterium]|nr:Imm52 family immunity protein [Stellaceae bacterium]